MHKGPTTCGVGNRARWVRALVEPTRARRRRLACFRHMVSVLVVDDDAPVRRMLERTLAAEAYSVATAGDGGAALAAIERSVPDVVVLDLGLPGVDGLSVCRRVRGKGLALPILRLTARRSEERRVGKERGSRW